MSTFQVTNSSSPPTDIYIKDPTDPGAQTTIVASGAIGVVVVNDTNQAGVKAALDDVVTRVAGVSYVLVSGTGPSLGAARVVATANITLSAPQTIDGVSVVAGDRVLVTGQSTASQNGVYVCAVGAWARSTDFNTALEMVTGTTVPVFAGTVYAGSEWEFTTSGAITVGSTSLTFLKVGSTALATSSLSGLMSAAQFNQLSGNVSSITLGAAQFAYSGIIDLVAGVGTYQVIPPTPARMVAFRLANSFTPIWEIKTFGGTVSVGPVYSIGSNSPNFNNVAASQTGAGFQSSFSPVAEQSVSVTQVATPLMVDLTTSGLWVNVTAGATGSAPVVTARIVCAFMLVPL